MEGLDQKKLFQISMDGPKVNHKFYEDIIAKCKENLFHTLVNLGTCSLHSDHGAIKTGAEKVPWNTKKIIKGSFQILHRSPVRREDYESVTGSRKYPLFFCATRWVENKMVTDRLLEIWPNIQQMVKFGMVYLNQSDRLAIVT